MDITCQGCGKRYTIRDEKLPLQGETSVICPLCGEEIKINLSDINKNLSQPTKNSAIVNNSAFDAFEFNEPEAPIALVYCPQEEAWYEITKSLKELNFHVKRIKSAADIAGRFQYSSCDLVLLFQNGPEPEPALQEIHQFLNSLEPDRRKELFVVYLHLSGNRYNNLQAFRYSVDITLNPLDLASLVDFLPRAMKQKEQRYKVIKECIKEVNASQGTTLI